MQNNIFDEQINNIQVNPGEKKDLLIYIHIPFCENKCKFCCWTADYPNQILQDINNIQNQYVDALCKQIQYIGPRLMEWGYVPKYIYWGGGTPSKLSVKNFDQIINSLFNSFDLSRIEEHTFESHPSSIDDEKIHFLSSHGVNRISVGVQSFNNVDLKRLGRTHTAEDAINTINILKKNGINNYNIDLMFAYPEHKFEIWESTLKQALSLNPPHITTYFYRNMENTVFNMLQKKGLYKTVPLKESFKMLSEAKKIFNNMGFSEMICGYFNRKPEYFFKSEDYYYALEGDYIGFGCGANSTILQHNLCNMLDSNSINRYLHSPISFDICKKYSPLNYNKYFSFIVLDQALSTQSGINFKRFNSIFGFNFTESKINVKLIDIMKKYKMINETNEGIFIPKENRDAISISVILNELHEA